MRELVYLAAARDDIERIFDHIASASGSIEIALGFTDRLRDRCRKLASLPGTLGQARPELRPDIRSIAEGNYLIFFRYSRNRVEIVDIIEGHRDLHAAFGSVPPETPNEP